MANFLRDQYITNISVTMDILKQINTLFISRAKALNASIQDSDTNEKIFINYIIRFNGKGYRIFSLEELLRYFDLAEQIERIIFTLESVESLRSNRQSGVCIELKLDQMTTNGCFLLVTSNDENWVDASFSAIQDILTKCKNKHGWMRTAWTPLAIQIVGVAIGFFISLWAAVKISPKLSIQNSFVICFLFILLIFSNTWGYLNQKILFFVDRVFPNLKFYRPDKDQSHWFTQAIIGGIALAITLWILNFSFSYIGQVLSEFVNKSS